VAVDADRNVVKPCPACQQAMYARWSTGELGPDFRLRRSGDAPDLRTVADGLMACRDTLEGPKRTQGVA
jgi:hypothetical protein